MRARQQPGRSAWLLLGLGVALLANAGIAVVSLILRQPDHPLFSDAVSYLLVFFAPFSVGAAIQQFVRAARIVRVNAQSQGRQ